MRRNNFRPMLGWSNIPLTRYAHCSFHSPNKYIHMYLPLTTLLARLSIPHSLSITTRVSTTLIREKGIVFILLFFIFFSHFAKKKKTKQIRSPAFLRRKIWSSVSIA